MANINLLPWRDAQRRERNRATLIVCAAMWAVAALVVLSGKLLMDSQINYQKARNAYLQTEIDALSKDLKEIEDLKERRDDLLARMDVIQTLQENRSQIVHVFDDLVTKIPDGVYYESITKAGDKLSIAGKAQSNNRVSNLMRSLDASDWFDGAKLKVVDVLDESGVSVSDFDIEVKEQRKDSNDDGVETVQ